MQVVKAAAEGKIQLTEFTPATLRHALRGAGNIVRPKEVEEVLQYVISDRDYSGLNGLYLILLTNNSVQKLAWHGCSPGSFRQRFFLAGDGDSQSIYALMSASTDHQVKPSQAWRTLSGYVSWLLHNNIVMLAPHV